MPALLTITIHIDPVLLRLGPFAVRWYGLMYLVGVVAATLVVRHYARSQGISTEKLYDLIWPSFIAGLIGGRLYYVLQNDLPAFLQNPGRIFAIWEGGMAFYGAIFAVALMLYFLSGRMRLSFGRVMDVGALFATVGQAFGRIGNLVNGDIVGYATTLPWGTAYTHPNNTFVKELGVAYQPAAAYEILFNIVLFVILWSLRFKLPRPGQLFVLYLALYAVGQFFIFFLRDNIVIVAGLKQAQLTSLAVLLLLVPVAYALTRRSKATPVSVESTPTQTRAARRREERRHKNSS